MNGPQTFDAVSRKRDWEQVISWKQVISWVHVRYYIQDTMTCMLTRETWYLENWK